jgi:transposase
MTYRVFIGIDVSKETIDVAVLQPGKTNQHRRLDNNVKGFTSLMGWMRKLTKCPREEWIFCMEHTGVYSLPLSCYLSEQHFNYCLESPYHLKHSLGLLRGKNDKLDAHRIADYIFRYWDKVKLHTFPGQIIIQLQNLLAHRTRLLKCKHRLAVPVAELKTNQKEVDNSFIIAMTEEEVKALDKKIKAVEKEMKRLIRTDEKVSHNYDLATSVTGIGQLIATTAIVHTCNFTTITDARKFCTYSGIAPFDESSGTSIYRKPKVSYLGNRKIKSLLTQGARSAIQHDRQMNNYFYRKLAEGKNDFSICNAVKNKLVARMFSVVKRGTPYVKLDTYSAPLKNSKLK